MCGIAGIWYKSEQNSGQEVIHKMTDVIAHRGLDCESHIQLYNGTLFLEHRRLSIIYLSDAGKQPMHYIERYTITYNGEIYNYLELRDTLQSKGYRFNTATVTEVIMAAYDYWDETCLKQFDGNMDSLFPIIPKAMRTIKRKLSGVGAVAEIAPELHNAFKKRSSPFVVHNELSESLRYYTLVSGLDKLLRFADRNSMAHSLEVRLPFLYHELVEFVFSLPTEYKIRNGWTKALLRYSLSDILPDEITWRKNKLGFSPPQKIWEKSKVFIDYLEECKKNAIERQYIANNAPIT